MRDRPRDLNQVGIDALKARIGTQMALHHTRSFEKRAYFEADQARIFAEEQLELCSRYIKGRSTTVSTD